MEARHADPRAGQINTGTIGAVCAGGLNPLPYTTLHKHTVEHTTLHHCSSTLGLGRKWPNMCDAPAAILITDSTTASNCPLAILSLFALSYLFPDIQDRKLAVGKSSGAYLFKNMKQRKCCKYPSKEMWQYRPNSQHDLVTRDQPESLREDQGSGLLTQLSLFITLSFFFILFPTISMIWIPFFLLKK